MELQEVFTHLVEELKAGRLSRRSFLKLLALIGTHGTVERALTVEHVLAASPLSTLRSFGYMAQPSAVPDYRFSVVRPDELLNLTYEFYNARRSDGHIEKIKPQDPAYMVVVFPSQHIVEETISQSSDGSLQRYLRGVSTGIFDEASGQLAITRATLSGTSRISFLLKDTGIDLRLAALLDWAQLSESVSVTPNKPAVDGIDVTIAPPTPIHTAIELPSYVILIPDPGTNKTPMRWMPQGSTTLNNRSPLWHVKRSVINADGDADPTRSTRFFFGGSPLLGKNVQLPVNTALTANDIRNTISQYGNTGSRYLRTDNLLLSALGAWLKLRDVTDGVTGDTWIHTTTMGRDQFVRIVQKGFLYPFGHRAERVAISERRFILQDRSDRYGNTVNGDHVTSNAYLVKQEFIVVREPERNYEAAQPSFPHEGRELPFKFIRIVTDVTPLLTPTSPDQHKQQELHPFIPTTGAPDNTREIQFDLVGTDHDGAQISFRMPLVFVPDPANATDQDRVDRAEEASRLYTHPQIPMRGQQISFTPINRSESLTNSLLITQWISFTADAADRAQGKFVPRMQSANVLIPEIGRLTGVSEDVSRDITYASNYLTDGFPTDSNDVNAANKQQVFAIFGSPASLNMPPERMGIATPSFTLDGLSRLAGPVPFARAMNNIVYEPNYLVATPNVAPIRDLAQLSGDIFGGVTLAAILYIADTDHLLQSFNPANYTAMNRQLQKAGSQDQSKAEAEIRNFLEGDDNLFFDTPGVILQESKDARTFIQNSFIFKPQIKDVPPPPFVRVEDKRITLTLVVTVKIKLDGKNPEFMLQGKLKDFGVSVFGIIEIDFKDISFKTILGESPKVEPHIDTVKFQGALAFIQKLAEKFKGKDSGSGGGAGAASPIKIDFSVTPYIIGIAAKLSLTIMPFTVGIFTLKNLKFTIGIDIPFKDVFIGNPPVGSRAIVALFQIADRAAPFTVSVTPYGGAGYFALKVDLKGTIRLVEVSIEFGGMASIGIGIAKGIVYLMGGIYFGLKNDGSRELKFEVYIRLGGKLDILGLIAIAVEFYLALGYREADEDGKRYGIMYGLARVHVEVTIVFFTISAELEVKKEFKNEIGTSGNAYEGPLPLVDDRKEPVLMSNGKPLPRLAKMLLQAAQPTPSFADAISLDQWISYCDAFASEGA